MATYNITTQTDLENLPTLTSQDTVRLLNDIALSSEWTPLGSFSSATFDGNGYSITNLTTRTNYFATASNTASNIVIGSIFTLAGTGAHTIAWTQYPITGTGSHKVIGTSNDNDGVIKWSSNTGITYAVGTGSAWSPATWTVSAVTTPKRFVIVRNISNVTLYINGVSQGTKTVIANVAYVLKATGFMIHASGTWTSGFNHFLVTSDVKDTTWIAKDYNSGLFRVADSTNTPNMTYYWKTQEGSGTTSTATVGGKNLSNIGGWASGDSRGGFIASMTGGTIKNVRIISPNISNTAVSAVGGLIGSCTNTTITGCSVEGGTIYNGYNSADAVTGGLLGSTPGCTISNCFTSLDSVSSVTTGRSGALVGNLHTSTLSNCYSTGCATNKPRGGLVGYDWSSSITNCFSTADAISKELVGWWDGSGTFTNNWFYDRSLGETHGTSFAIADAYDITHAPLSSWDFTPTGYWSKSQDGVTYPPLATNFSGSISGSVTGLGSGKTMKLIQLDKNYRVKNYSAASGYGSIPALTLGTVHTIAFTTYGWTNNSIMRRQASGDTGVYAVSGTIIRYGDGSGSKFVEMWNSGMGGSLLDGTLRRFVFTRNGSTVKMYCNNVLIKTATGYTGGTSNTWDTILSGGTGGAGQTAYIDELVITTDEKDATWVSTDYNNGKFKRYDTGESNLLHLWHFDEGVGLTATDAKSSVVCTFTAAPTWERNYTSVSYVEYSATTTGSGDFSFTSVAGDRGEPIEIYVSGDAINGAIVATLPDGLMGNVTGISIDANQIAIGYAGLHDSMTYALAALLNPYPLAETCYRTASNIIYYRDGCDCLIPTGCTYTGVIQPDTAETGDIIVDGTATLSGTINGLDVSGTLTMSSGTINGDIVVSGTFTADNLYTQMQVYSDNITNTGTLSIHGAFWGDVNFSGDMTLIAPIFVTDNATLTFGAGDTYTISYTASFGTGQTLQSDSAGTRFIFDSDTEQTISNATIIDSEVSGSDWIAYHSTGSNTDKREASPHWVFPIDINAFITEYATA